MPFRSYFCFDEMKKKNHIKSLTCKTASYQEMNWKSPFPGSLPDMRFSLVVFLLSNCAIELETRDGNHLTIINQPFESQLNIGGVLTMKRLEWEAEQ